jgi:anti-sigma B factor antagonist
LRPLRHRPVSVMKQDRSSSLPSVVVKPHAHKGFYHSCGNGIGFASAPCKHRMSKTMKDESMNGGFSRQSHIDRREVSSAYLKVKSDVNPSILIRLGTHLLRTVRYALRRRRVEVEAASKDVSMRIEMAAVSSGMDVLHLSGRLDMTSTPTFRRTLQVATQRSRHGLTVSLAGVEFMDSSGIAVLIEGLRWSQKRGTRYVLANLTPRVRMAIELARVEKLFSLGRLADVPVDADFS